MLSESYSQVPTSSVFTSQPRVLTKGSDHIQGLEGAYNAPFIYCSAATKELLIRLERRMHRLNWQKRIVESHECKYKDKKRLLVWLLYSPGGPGSR